MSLRRRLMLSVKIPAIGVNSLSMGWLHRITANGAELPFNKGYGKISSIKGNTLVWNQLVQNGDFSNGIDKWVRRNTSSKVTLSNDNGVKVTVDSSNGSSTSSSWYFAVYVNNQALTDNCIVGHKYYYRIRYSISSSAGSDTKLKFVIGGDSSINTNLHEVISPFVTKSNDVKSNIVNCAYVSQFSRLTVLFIGTGSASQEPLTVNDSYTIHEYAIYDLTQMFGAGNEPSTPAEFEALFPLSYYANDGGRLLNFTAEDLVSKDSSDNTLSTIELDITTLTGKVNGEGTSEVIFADGMKSAGSAYDEIVKVDGVWKAVKRVGSKNLGDCTWSLITGTTYCFKTSTIKDSLSHPSTVYPKQINNKGYASAVGYDTNMEDKFISINSAMNSDDIIIIKDSTYDGVTATEFKAAMDGVYLNYELEEPITYILDDVIQDVLNVATGGVEKILPINTSVPTTSPAKIDISYSKRI